MTACVWIYTTQVILPWQREVLPVPVAACVQIYAAQVILPWQSEALPVPQQVYFTNDCLCVDLHCTSYPPLTGVILPWQREALPVPWPEYFTNELSVSLHCMSYLTMAERGTTSPTVSVLYQ